MWTVLASCERAPPPARVETHTVTVAGSCPPPPPPTPTTPTTPSSPPPPCDDGLACTADTLDASGRCLATPRYDCGWPAAAPSGAIAIPHPALEAQVSGATWNPFTRELWVVRNADPSAVVALADDGAGGWAEVGVWTDVGDVESIAQVDPEGRPREVLVLDEGRGNVLALDLTAAAPVVLHDWNLSALVPDDQRSGAEGLAFVPDAALSAWAFVDDAGAARVSAGGLGGLVFVGHQNGGQVYAFDLDVSTNDRVLVGTYDTARAETSGLEFDPATERLYLWHGGEWNDLEVARLSSTDRGGPHRALDLEAVFDHPGAGNLEGIAVFGADDCGPDGRSLIVVQDDGLDRSVLRYPDWPLGCP